VSGPDDIGCWREPHESATHKVTILFAWDGYAGREVYWVRDTRKLRWNTDPIPEGIAWGKLERELIFDCDVATEECSCCISREDPFDVAFLIERLEADDSARARGETP
jgi:hypothetical protein